MPVDSFKLPTDETARLIFGQRHPGKGTTYLNATRLITVDNDHEMAREYHSMVPHYAGSLANLVISEVGEFDAVVSPPSSRSDAQPFREAILKKNSMAVDLTQGFSRRGEVRMSDPSTTIQKAIDEFSYTAKGCESEVKSLLIVDESVSSGKTISAVLHHMRHAGLSANCNINIVAWARF